MILEEETYEQFGYHARDLKPRSGKKILKKYGWKLVVFWQEDLERKDAEAYVLNELQKGGIIKEK